MSLRPVVACVLTFVVSVLVLIVVGRVAPRRRLRRLMKQFPGAVDVLKRGWVPAEAPDDPHVLATTITIPAEAGRPGEQFSAPGPLMFSQATGPDGSRADATIKLTRSAYFLVVCLGRLDAREPAALRPDRSAARLAPGWPRLRLTESVQTSAGLAYRHTIGTSTGRRLTDWHVDHDGWAYAIGFLRSPEDEPVLGAVERMIASCQWLPRAGGAPGPDPG